MQVMMPPPEQSADGEVSEAARGGAGAGDDRHRGVGRQRGADERHGGERAVPGRDGERGGADGAKLGGTPPLPDRGWCAWSSRSAMRARACTGARGPAGACTQANSFEPRMRKERTELNGMTDGSV
jgi:hypothetical protein